MQKHSEKAKKRRPRQKSTTSGKSKSRRAIGKTNVWPCSGGGGCGDCDDGSS
jgi:hypothetical protein